MEGGGTLQAPVTYLHPGAQRPFYQLLTFEGLCSHPGWNSEVQIWETLDGYCCFAHSSSCGQMIGHVPNITYYRIEHLDVI